MSQTFPRKIIISLLVTSAMALAGATQSPDEANVRYTSVDQLPIAAEPGGEPFANLYVTSAVELVETDGDAALVRVRGFGQPSEDGAVTDIFTDDTNATRVAGVLDSTAVEVVAEEDGWAEVHLEGWVDSGALADGLELMFEEAAEVYDANCTRCHTGYAAPADVLRRTLPNARVERIVTNMARGTGVSDEHVNLIIQWFQKHPEDLGDS